jgi:hypothetical protein|nr:MAG TPA: Protein of unknown function (DUF1378) [Caudoviricetes sp.]
MNDIVQILTTIATIIATLGGWETIKYFLNRKTNKRKAEAEADSVEFTVLRQSVEFLQVQLQNKEKRFAEEIEVVRKLTTENLQLTSENVKLKTERSLKLCERRNCAQREPQSGY